MTRPSVILILLPMVLCPWICHYHRSLFYLFIYPDLSLGNGIRFVFGYILIRLITFSFFFFPAVRGV